MIEKLLKQRDHFNLQETLNTVDYYHKIYATNMEKFFKILSNLTEGVSIGKLLK